MKKLIATLTLAAAAAACSAQTPVTPGAQPSGTPSPSPSSVSTSSSGTTQVTIYYLVEGRGDLFITPERHQVAKTQAIARAALDELLHGSAQDEDHTIPFPKDAKVNSVVIDDSVATVDWSAEVLEASVGASVEALAIQSVVYTLTEFKTISEVRFTIEGKDSGTASNGRQIEEFWGHVGLSDQPWGREPAIEVLAPITLWTPLDDTSSSGTLQLSGLATSFEANVGIILRDAKNKIVMQTFATALGAGPAREPFTKEIKFTPPASPEQWTLQVTEDSGMEGAVLFMEDRTIKVG